MLGLCGVVVVQQDASGIFNITVIIDLTLEENVTFQKFHRKKKKESKKERKRKCQESRWSLSHSAIAKRVGNAFLVADDADICKGNLKAIDSVCFLIPAELREFTLTE